MRGNTLTPVVAWSLVFVLALSLGAVRPARSDDFTNILAGLAVGYLVYSALDNASSPDRDRDHYQNCNPPRDAWGYGRDQQGWSDHQEYRGEDYKGVVKGSRWDVPRGGYDGQAYDSPGRGRGNPPARGYGNGGNPPGRGYQGGGDRPGGW